MMTDPIADMLTRMRNGLSARHESVLIPFSKLKSNIADILKKEGYVSDVAQVENNGKPFLRVTLKYGTDGRGVIQAMDRVSKPGRRVYSKSTELPTVQNGYGISVISTPQGLLTNKEARKQGVGGEVLFSVS